MTWTLAGDIANRLLDLVSVTGVKHKELAKRAGVRPQQFSNWVGGDQKPPKSRLEHWAEREGWPIDIFSEGGPLPSTVLSSLHSSDVAKPLEKIERARDAALLEFDRIKTTPGELAASEGSSGLVVDLVRAQFWVREICKVGIEVAESRGVVDRPDRTGRAARG